MVRELVPEFERGIPGIRVDVQQIPWTAAHEKLLTAFVGDSTPDVAQVGNTWIPELAAIGAIEPLDDFVRGSRVVKAADYFPGIWDTNVVDGTSGACPGTSTPGCSSTAATSWRRRAFPEPPRTWSEWCEAMERLKERAGPQGFAILLPTDEWAQPVVLALQKGAPLLARRQPLGCVPGARASARAYESYRELYRRGYASVVPNSQVAQPLPAVRRGVRSRCTSPAPGTWASSAAACRRRCRTAGPRRRCRPRTARPGPEPRSPAAPAWSFFVLAQRKAAAWKLIEYLSRPEQQVRFFQLTGDLPSRTAAWSAPELAGDPQARAFWQQLQNVLPTPKVPEWEQIATLVSERAEAAIRGRATTEQALGDSG